MCFLVKQHIMAHQRAELVDRNKKLFTSIDMLVQVRLKEMEAATVFLFTSIDVLVQVRLKEVEVATADLPQPNVSRLSADVFSY